MSIWIKLFRPETEDEKTLKEEINYLKELMKGAEVNANGELVAGAAEERATLHKQILTKERDLETLRCDLNSKVRFGQRAASDRPSSGAGRIASFPDRPPSQSGMPDEPRSMEFMERPRSRGSDVWTRSGEDRKSFQSGRERGFFANRDMDRYAYYFDSLSPSSATFYSILFDKEKAYIGAHPILAFWAVINLDDL